MDVTLDKKLSGYKQIALAKLEHILLTILGKKDLVVEPDILRILDSFATMTWLKTKGFDKIFKLSSVAPPKTKLLVYMIPADLIIFKHVCDQITQLSNKIPDSEMNVKEFHIILIPNVFVAYKKLLESEGLAGAVELHRFSWDFIKIDRNLLSLELPIMYKNVFVKLETSFLVSIASSLRIFNMVHGRPKVIFSYGEHSEKILSMVSTMENFRRTTPQEVQEYPDFNAMLIMDRSKDITSCLLTPVSYSALMVELFESKAGILSIDSKSNKITSGKLKVLEVVEKKDDSRDENEAKTFRMCSTSDELYTSNKYLHFSEVVNLIQSESKKLDQERKKYSRDMSIEQMKNFVETNLPKVAAQKKILYKHLFICERIVEELSGNFEKQQNIEEIILRNGSRKEVLMFIDEQLHTNAHQWNILRLFCLLHVCVGGITAEEANKFVASYCNTFGHKYLYVFQNLFRANLFPDISRIVSKNLIGIAQSTLPKKTQFLIEAGKLKLIPNEEKSSSEGKTSKACPSYVFNGNYIPFVAQFANILLKAESIAEISNKFGFLDNIKISDSSIGDNLELLKEVSTHKTLNLFPIKPRSLLIFIVGGVTYAEIAACDMIESLTGSKIVIASDQVTSGIDIMKASY